MKGGIIFADLLNTVSPTYRNEILTPENGFGLEGVLKNGKKIFSPFLTGWIMRSGIHPTIPCCRPTIPVPIWKKKRSAKTTCRGFFS